MTTIGKNEEILLRVDSVKSRKGGDAGVLYVLATRLLWVDETNGAGSISHKYEDVRVQKISPEGKSKVQLQICLNNGDSTTFLFVNDGGVEKQLHDREAVKELFQQLLPKFRNRLSQELEQKQKVLQENKELFRLYKELVTTSVISADEFWQTYAAEKLNHKPADAQKVGVPTGFLSDVAKADGCNVIKLNLTADIMEAIFRTYPAVRKKHLEVVPHQMTEKEFWTQFFQSHYFHRDRSTNLTPKELFADCIKLDEEDLQSQLQKTSDKERGGLRAYDEDKGLADHITQLDDDDRGKVRNPAYTALLRRFNYHSSRVLQACLGDEGPSTSAGTNNQAAYSLGSMLPTTSRDYDDSSTAHSNKRKLVQCEDLVDEQSDDVVVLTLTNAEKYQQQHEINASTTNTATIDFSRNDAIRWCGMVAKWTGKLPRLSNADEVLTPDIAYKILVDLSSSATDRRDGDRNALSKSMVEELRCLYTAANELLRHFWCCFPTTTPELEQKANKMYETLRRYEEAKLKPFLERSHYLRSSTQAHPADHISRMLQVAYERYIQWKKKSS